MNTETYKPTHIHIYTKRTRKHHVHVHPYTHTCTFIRVKEQTYTHTKTNIKDAYPHVNTNVHTRNTYTYTPRQTHRTRMQSMASATRLDPTHRKLSSFPVPSSISIISYHFFPLHITLIAYVVFFHMKNASLR